jgi:MYXO-CTERM domain-containing protein
MISRALFGLAILAFAAFPATASAYTIETPVTDGCHEKIAAEGLREVRTLAPPLAGFDPDDGPLVDDVPFTVPEDMRDIGATTFLLGIRDNDLKDLAATALDELAEATADPATQREHCLRTEGQIEPNGSQAAIADCRAFVKSKLLSALDGLGPDGKPDQSLRDELEVTLALRGKYTARVPRFYLRMGQAIHALQDSYTHTFRDPEQKKITVVLDWIHFAENTLDESVDGPPHLTELDRCDDPDDLRAKRHRRAVEATAGALRIALDPKLDRAGKSAAFDALLDEHLGYSAGCTAANDWCHAAENEYRPGACGCSTPGSGSTTRAGWVLGMIVATLVLRRRRTLLALGMLVGLGREAHAQQSSALPEAPEHEAKGPIAAVKGESEAAQPGTRDPKGSIFAHAAFGASYDKPAMAMSIGGKYQFSRSWMLGLDAEWNPWIRTTPTTVRAGTGNLYASLVRRYQLAYEPVNLRTTAALGASMLLIDLPGARKNSFGPMVGVSFLGLEWKLARGCYLVVDPTYIIYTVPHVTGTPLGYLQYRFQVGLELGG